MKARIYSPTPRNLRLLAKKLRDNELVAIPTETVYGLAAHALDEEACRKIFKAKGRPENDPLIVHVLDLEHAELLAVFNDEARAIAARFWPGPLTLVLPKRECIPPIVTSGRKTVAIRVPAHPLTRKILKLAGVPLAAPSANPFGYVSPTTAAHVSDGLGNRIASILDGGSCLVGVESTILDLTHPSNPRILRPGAITAASLTNALGKKPSRPVAKKKPEDLSGLLAPGMLDQHYSPHTPLIIKPRWTKLPPRVAGILLRQPAGKIPPRTYWLSRRASLTEIARNIYQVLRTADRGKHHEIWIESLAANENTLAAAINDRIKRAAARA